MKTRIIVLLGFLFLLNSCILKSLQPFYIAKAISYQENLVGDWEDGKKGTWNIASFKAQFEKENKGIVKLSEEDIAMYNKYKSGFCDLYRR